MMVWKPHVTVAAVVEREGRFLLVEENTPDGVRFNQPAGHLEAGETLQEAVVREVKEETAWQFVPEHVLSIHLWRKSPNESSFLRCCFTGRCVDYQPDQPLDEGIIATHWLSPEEIRAASDRHRSPLVTLAVEEYLSGQRYPLSLMKSLLDSGHG
jgi:8-oxo-dGTP pyrophosphatase MutT (NUDIX family)